MPTRYADNRHLRTIAPALIVLILIVGCEGGQPAPTPVLPTATLVLPAASPMSPTATPVSEATPTAAVTPLPTLTGSGGGVIAFASNRDGNYEIYVMNADGTDQRRLTNHGAREGSPAWSPDGTRIAFMSERNGNGDIYVMAVPGGTDADGAEQGSGDPQLLTRSRAFDGEPAWSPDGTQIAFISYRNDMLLAINYEIYVMNADGSDPRRLTNNPARDGYLSWSPDGTRIAFNSDRSDHWDIYVMNPDGSGVQRLTSDDADDQQPAWSPDGTQIAFVSNRDGNYEIYVMAAPDGTDADGAEQGSGTPRRLTNNDVDDEWPHWSPDGTQIVFQSNTDGQWDIYVMNADGTNRRRLTTNDANDYDPAWRP